MLSVSDEYGEAKEVEHSPLPEKTFLVLRSQLRRLEQLSVERG